jgi:2-amino-4-hydroxy-6-hydroxymethyldihydropteridine diphosphokinase
MHERAFVIVPLVEIAPDATIPGRGRASDLVQHVNVASVARLAPQNG